MGLPYAIWSFDPVITGDMLIIRLILLLPDKYVNPESYFWGTIPADPGKLLNYVVQ